MQKSPGASAKACSLGRESSEPSPPEGSRGPGDSGDWGGPRGRWRHDGEGSRVAVTDVLKEGANGSKPCIPRPDGVRASLLKMIEKTEDGFAVQVVESKPARRSSAPLRDENEEELESIAIGGNCGRAGPSLSSETVTEVGLKQLSKTGSLHCLHDQTRTSGALP